MDLQEQLQKTLGSAYRLERELAGGGMSRVFVASETSLGRRVVVKVLSPDLAAGVSTERFRKEIQLAASLQHPHIVSVLAAGEADGILYYTMPFIEGVALRARLSQSGELPVAEAVQVLRDVTRALAYAHRRGVVHRDIKPENVLLSEDGAMVVDFGVAKALSASTGSPDSSVRTGIGVALGTPAYMSPEQAAADPLTDHRSDLYSLGILAYELLAGFAPFAGRPLQAIFAAHASEFPEGIEKRRSGVPPRLGAVVMKCLQKRPADRPQSAEAVLRDLDAVALTLGVESPEAGHPRLRARRALTYSALGVALVVAAVAGAARVRRTNSSAMPPGTVAATRRIAVLPFENISPSRADESFSDGMTEELIGALGKVEALRVKSAFSLKGSRKDIPEIGKELGVESVVAGSVRRSGDRLRISARLVNVADGFQVWSDSYERELHSTADVFRVQDDISAAIVGALKLKLSLAASAGRQAGRQTESLEAYKALLNGRFFMARRTPQSLRSAIQFLEGAVRLDSNYALAWSSLADANALLLAYGFENPSERVPRALRAVERALTLDSTLAEAHATLGLIGLELTNR